MKKLFLYILLSLGLSAISYAGPYDDWPDDAVCMWLDMKPTHAGYLGEAKKRGISCEGGVAVKTQIESSDAFDGSYSFIISRYNENDGHQDQGNGYIEINNGIMTVAKEGRTLDTGSIDLYDSFEGQIDKDGNISAVFTVNALVGVGSPEPIDFRGTIDALQIKGTFDHYFDMVIKFKRGSYSR